MSRIRWMIVNDCAEFFVVALFARVLTKGIFFVAHEIAPMRGSDQVDMVIAAAIATWCIAATLKDLSRNASLPWALFTAIGLETAVFAWWAFTHLMAEPKTALWVGGAGLAVAFVVYLWRRQYARA